MLTRGRTLIRKTSLLRKIEPIARRSSFANKDHLQPAHLAMTGRRNDLEIVIEYRRIASQIPNSDRSPLYDVRNHACVPREGQRMRSDVSRTIFLATKVRLDQPFGCATRNPKGEAWWSQTGSNR